MANANDYGLVQLPASSYRYLIAMRYLNASEAIYDGKPFEFRSVSSRLTRGLAYRNGAFDVPKPPTPDLPGTQCG